MNFSLDQNFCYYFFVFNRPHLKEDSFKKIPKSVIWLLIEKILYINKNMLIKLLMLPFPLYLEGNKL